VRSEADLITGFLGRVAELRPRMVTFNGCSFDLPVLRYSALMNKVSALGLGYRSYFHRYTDDALDLCDCLASFNSGGRGAPRSYGSRGKLPEPAMTSRRRAGEANA
jgi:predicted PolB exonuclease-like 3'-5' exonuclease